jgi:primosomal protein N' (replication factor Y) (superfamily II helicase)
VVRGRYRFRILVKVPRNFDISAYSREWLAAVPKAKGTLSSNWTSIRRAFSDAAR